MHHEKVAQYFLGHISGWFEDDREGQGQLDREKHSHKVIEHSAREVLEDIPCSGRSQGGQSSPHY